MLGSLDRSPLELHQQLRYSADLQIHQPAFDTALQASSTEDRYRRLCSLLMQVTGQPVRLALVR